MSDASLTTQRSNAVGLVSEVEGVRGSMFALTMTLLLAASAASAALLPLRIDGDDIPVRLVFLALVAVSAAITLARWSSPVRELLGREPAAQAAAVIVASVAVLDEQSALWWVACAVLCVLATTVSVPRAVGCCTIVLMANLVAHLARGGLDDVQAVAIVGLWVGLPFWTVAIGATLEYLCRFRLHTHPTILDPSPDEPLPADANEASARLLTTARQAGQLTARELQVVLLLSVGLTPQRIATLLAIKPGTVYRHSDTARRKLGVTTTPQLVRIATIEGAIPRSRLPPGALDPPDSAP